MNSVEISIPHNPNTNFSAMAPVGDRLTACSTRDGDILTCNDSSAMR